MGAPEKPEAADNAAGRALRAVRDHRGLRQEDVAEGTGISRRTYLALEAGSVRVSLNHLAAFATFTDSDLFALMAAIQFNRPSLAVACADNKLLTIMMMAGDDFETAVGKRMAQVRPYEMMKGLKGLFDQLADDLGPDGPNPPFAPAPVHRPRRRGRP